METISKDEILHALDKLIKARCECSRQQIIEKQCFEMCRMIVMKAKTYEVNQDVR